MELPVQLIREEASWEEGQCHLLTRTDERHPFQEALVSEVRSVAGGFLQSTPVASDTGSMVWEGGGCLATELPAEPARGGILEQSHLMTTRWPFCSNDMGKPHR